MKVTREQAASACMRILGSKVYFALREARISLPTILNLAAKECFLRMHTVGEDTCTVRAALLKLEKDGALE